MFYIEVVDDYFEEVMKRVLKGQFKNYNLDEEVGVNLDLEENKLVVEKKKN